MVKEKAVNPWGQLYEFLGGRELLNLALEPNIKILYMAIRDFSAHFAIFDSTTPTTMAPQNELPMLLVANHCLDAAETPEHEVERAIERCSVGRLSFYSNDDSWNPNAEPLYKFAGRIHPSPVLKKVMKEPDPRVIEVWKTILIASKEKHACSAGSNRHPDKKQPENRPQVQNQQHERLH
ncbi:hypothetical protein [Aeromonas sp. Y311-2]|uniref:hypothetical protein n=1 Tax=Aeromonas sp. Y311-2 TaxID=2990507 RepID=UPI0022E269AD|nr:hypothetical protein [Aeromonas sp. Y311-2]